MMDHRMVGKPLDEEGVASHTMIGFALRHIVFFCRIGDLAKRTNAFMR